MRILMVCLGNICRSPLAEGIMDQKLKQAGIPYAIDSAGTGGWHSGERPDQRSVQVAARYGIDISHQKARKLRKEDLQHFDLILAMDQSNYRDIVQLSDPEEQNKVHLFLEFAGMGKKDVPDPWYGGPEDFEAVFQLLEEACQQSLSKILKYNTI